MHASFRLLLLFALIGLKAPDACASREPPASSIEEVRREYRDSSRSNWAGNGPRVIRAIVWSSPEHKIVPPDALPRPRMEEDRTGTDSVAVAARHPLVVVSPGSGNSAREMQWLGQVLAKAGYVVAAVEHNGRADEELGRRAPTLTDFFAWERARDLSVVISGLLEDPELAPRIAAEQIGAAGFSLGGTTALWAGGARLDLDTLRQNAEPPPASIAPAIDSLIAYSKVDPVAVESVDRAGHSYRDPRIKAAFALAPPMGAGFTPEGLSTVEVPVCIVVGDADPIAPAETNARHFAAHIVGARLLMVPGERGHYVQPGSAAVREAELNEVAQIARTFFDEQLRSRGVSAPLDGKGAAQD